MPRPSAKPNKASSPVAVRAAIYLRVSTEDQAADGYGIDVQRQRTKAQIEAKGWELTGEYVDAGISGTKDVSERPGLAAVIEAAQSGEIDAVVILALDRLGRNTRLVLSLVEMLAASDVAIVSCKESLDTSTPQGQFVLTMFAALAQLERDTIVERTTAGRNERGKQDGEKGGRVPFGYVRLPDGEIVVDQTAADIVQVIFDRRTDGMTMAEIADYLNSNGYKTARADQQRYKGTKWYASSVKCVLDNEAAYHGGYRGASPMRWTPILRTPPKVL